MKQVINGYLEIYGTADTLYLTETGGDYHLQSNSNCIDSSDAASKPVGNDDIEGNVRPTDIAGKGDGTDDYDKGAYEYVE